MNRPFLKFVLRCGGNLVLLTLAYSLYLNFFEKVGDLDIVTYKVSQWSLAFAQQIGLNGGDLICYLNGCSAGSPGRMVDILQSCNGVRILTFFAAYVFAFGWNWKSAFITLLGLLVVQSINIIRIGSLIALRDFSGDTYFNLVENVFNAFIYGIVIVLIFTRSHLMEFLSRRMQRML